MKPKDKQVKVLLLYAKVGGGHESIAKAIGQRLEEEFGDSLNLKMIDPTNSFMNSAYQVSTLISTRFYNLAYRLLQKVSQDRLTQKLLDSLAVFFYDDSLKKVISECKPDFIISTHFMFTQKAKQLVVELGMNTKVAVYIADPFSIHPVWIADNTDLYLCYDEAYLPKEFAYLKSQNKIISVGMPIRSEFYQTYDRLKIRKELGLDPDAFTIYFGGSGYGMDNLERLIQPFKELESGCQAIFVCGRNKILEKGLKMIANGKNNIRVLGYLEGREVASNMQASDLFVGKVGPNVMFETILSGIPGVATPPILAQERGNRVFMDREGIGFLSYNPTQTMNIIRRIIQHPEMVKQRKERIEKVAKQTREREEKGMKLFFDWMRTHQN